MTLNVDGITFGYTGQNIIENIAFSAERGEVLAVLGTNGTGKSTLLQCLSRILHPASGTVIIDGESICNLNRVELAKRIAYIEQSRSGSHMTVFDSVLLGRKPHICWDVTKHDMDVVESTLARLGLTDFAMKYTDEMSGGELQKVSVARALAQEATVLLMDEPTSNLDLKNQLEVLDVIRQITVEQNTVSLVVMHDLNLALRYADKFLFLKEKEVYAFGGDEIVTSDNVETVYGVPVTIQTFENKKIIIPM